MSAGQTTVEPAERDGSAAQASGGRMARTPQRADGADARPAPPAEHADGGGGGGGDHDDSVPSDLQKPSSLAVVLAVIGVVVLLAGLFVVGWVPHHLAKRQANDDANTMAADVPVVSVVFPKKNDAARELVYPATVRANQSTAIYTRSTGFLKHWYVDIQDHVTKGQLLAEIDAPDLDAQLSQAQASLNQDIANVAKSDADLKLADVTVKRYVEAQKVSPGSVTEEQVDQQRNMYDDAVAALNQSKASVAQAQATVQQLQAEVSFEKLTAPFDGVITTRNFDNGAFLSPPTNTSTGGREVFDIAQIDLLRVYVNVPQPDSTAVQVGKPVYLTVQNYGPKKFAGVVARTSGSLDETTRTLTVELDFPNKDSSLYPGMYGQAHLPVSNADATLLVPTSALLFNADGTTVALVKDDKVHIQPVKVGRDFGTMLEVTSGLTTADEVVTNPGEKLAEGISVNVPVGPDGKPTDGHPKSQAGASASG